MMHAESDYLPNKSAASAALQLSIQSTQTFGAERIGEILHPAMIRRCIRDSLMLGMEHPKRKVERHQSSGEE